MKTILITEDKSEVRELIMETLRIGDYKLIEAASGEQAVALSREWKPDLIIMDLMMPGAIDGLRATHIIKNTYETRHCKIIILTAKGQQEDIEAGMQAGADNYFIKPFSPLELIKQVEYQLQ